MDLTTLALQLVINTSSETIVIHSTPAEDMVCAMMADDDVDTTLTATEKNAGTHTKNTKNACNVNGANALKRYPTDDAGANGGTTTTTGNKALTDNEPHNKKPKTDPTPEVIEVSSGSEQASTSSDDSKLLPALESVTDSGNLSSDSGTLGDILYNAKPPSHGMIESNGHSLFKYGDRTFLVRNEAAIQKNKIIKSSINKAIGDKPILLWDGPCPRGTIKEWDPTAADTKLIDPTKKIKPPSHGFVSSGSPIKDTTTTITVDPNGNITSTIAGAANGVNIPVGTAIVTTSSPKPKYKTYEQAFKARYADRAPRTHAIEYMDNDDPYVMKSVNDAKYEAETIVTRLLRAADNLIDSYKIPNTDSTSCTDDRIMALLKDPSYRYNINSSMVMNGRGLLMGETETLNDGRHTDALARHTYVLTGLLADHKHETEEDIRDLTEKASDMFDFMYTSMENHSLIEKSLLEQIERLTQQRDSMEDHANYLDHTLIHCGKEHLTPECYARVTDNIISPDSLTAIDRETDMGNNMTEVGDMLEIMTDEERMKKHGIIAELAYNGKGLEEGHIISLGHEVLDKVAKDYWNVTQAALKKMIEQDVVSKNYDIYENRLSALNEDRNKWSNMHTQLQYQLEMEKIQHAQEVDSLVARINALEAQLKAAGKSRRSIRRIVNRTLTALIARLNTIYGTASQQRDLITLLKRHLDVMAAQVQMNTAINARLRAQLRRTIQQHDALIRLSHDMLTASAEVAHHMQQVDPQYQMPNALCIPTSELPASQNWADIGAAINTIAIGRYPADALAHIENPFKQLPDMRQLLGQPLPDISSISIDFTKVPKLDHDPAPTETESYQIYSDNESDDSQSYSSYSEGNDDYESDYDSGMYNYGTEPSTDADTNNDSEMSGGSTASSA